MANGNKQIKRRTWLKSTAGILGLSALGLGVSSTGATSTSDYDVVEVPAGETYSVRLRDGDTLEDLIIDVSASGAAYRIVAIGSGWAVRNVGVRGRFDSQTNDSLFGMSVPDETGQAVVENVYLPGAASPGHNYNGPEGMYVGRDHAGDILIRNVNIQRMQDNGIYASSPGHAGSGGAGGTVRVENSYFEANATANIRLGTDGSYAENCVMKDGLHRGYWAYYEHTELRHCDILGSRNADIVLGGTTYDKKNYAEVTSDGSRFESVHHGGSSNALHGDNGDNPETRIPEGVPTSAEEAASGRTSENDDETEGGETPDDDRHLVAFISEEGAESLFYEFTAGGAVEFTEAPYDSPSGRPIEGGTWNDVDYIEEGEETWEAGGGTGLGYGDAFLVEGPVLDVSLASTDEMWIELDGEEVSPDELVEQTAPNDDDGEDDPDEGSDEDEGTDDDSDDGELPHTIVIDGSESDDLAHYRFSVSGSVEPDPELTSVEEGGLPWDSMEDLVSEDEVVGVVGKGQDGYRFSGEITEKDVHGDASVEIDN